MNPYPISQDLTVAETVLSHSSCAPVFQRHKIDFCCKGHLSIAEAASTRGVDLDLLLAELDEAISQRQPGAIDPARLSTPALIAHLISRHHAYLREAIPFILRLSDKVSRVHGAHEPRLVVLDQVVRSLAAALLPHLDQEEEILFPQLMSRSPDRALLERELAAMFDDHLAVGAMLHEIRHLTDDFTPPSWACTSFRTLFSELHTLEGDTLTHVHLENHALMPRFAAPAPAPTATPQVAR